MAARRRPLDPRLEPVSRWTPARKDELVLAVRRGELTEDQVIAAHRLERDEWQSWMARQDRHGRAGLSIKHLQATRP